MNNRSKTWAIRGGIAILVIVVAAAWILRGGAGRPSSSSVQAAVQALPSAPGNFARAEGPRDFTFPEDFGAHPDFQTEWWYYTGNLSAEDGRQFGFQLTFFRRSLSGADLQEKRESQWGTQQAYLAHFALTDVTGKAFFNQERLERGAAGLAGAKGAPLFEVWLHDWKAVQTGDRQYRLTAIEDDWGLDLTLVDMKGPVLQGDRGYSRKGPEPGNASYYISQTRLKASGNVKLNQVDIPVEGLAWMDHEFSTSALAADQVGWDWFAIQLDDGTDWMVYTLRKIDGTIDPASKGSKIGPDGSVRSLTEADFSLSVTDRWISPHNGAEYPSGWVLKIPSEDLELVITPKVADQEWNATFIYWEGAVMVQGTHAGRVVRGNGYVELTGYGQSMQNRF